MEGWTAVHCGVAAGWKKRSAATVVRVEIQGQELGNLAGGAVQLADSHKGRYTVSLGGTVMGEEKKGGKEGRKKESEGRRDSL